MREICSHCGEVQECTFCADCGTSYCEACYFLDPHRKEGYDEPDFTEFPLARLLVDAQALSKDATRYARRSILYARLSILFACIAIALWTVTLIVR